MWETLAAFGCCRCLAIESRSLTWMRDFTEQFPRLSPDGRWLAYQSNGPNHDEVYVVSFPQKGAGKVADLDCRRNQAGLGAAMDANCTITARTVRSWPYRLRPARSSGPVPKPLFEVRIETALNGPLLWM